MTDWLKLNPFKLNAIVLIPNEVNQIPITGHAARKKCNERLLLNEAYWKINRPKYPWAATMLGFFFLSEFVAVVLALSFGCLTH
jgi:hypothetical protein